MNDTWPVIQWERVVHDLAVRAGVRVAATRLVAVDGKQVMLSRRFDRAGHRRIPYLSALAMLGARDGEESSYIELTEVLRQHGVDVLANLIELWRRLVFNILISNTDDHLRNHGFLRQGQGWVLAPAFDLNPVPVDVKPRLHQLALDDHRHDAPLDRVFETASFYGLEESAARSMAKQIAEAVSTWRVAASAAGLNARQQNRMASAFEHEDLAEALR
jgi:serine/threonine-protein kinase HipA